MTAAAQARPPFRITGWHVLIGMTLFFAIVIGVDAWFITKAYSTFSGQVAKNPYEAGLAYNRQIAEQERQARLGWTVTAGVDGPDLVVIARDRDGRPLDALSVRVVMERPATDAGKLSLQLKPAGDGVYRLRNPAGSGAWDLKASLVGPGDARFSAERRLVLP